MPKKSESPPNRNRIWLVLTVVALVIALFMTLRNSGERVPGPSLSSVGTGGGSVKTDRGNPQSSADPDAGTAPRTTRSSLNRTATTEEPAAPQFPQVERLLLDQSISEEQAAAGLFEIARNGELSLEERDEALAHGLNLDFGVFEALAMDPTLPLPLAQRYFDELLNRNEAPKKQIEGYLGFMGHGEEEIRTQAAEQLAFVLEDEDLAETPEELRKLAQQRLEVLKLEQPEKDQAVTGQTPE
jgi:hypothetical protein